MLASLRTTVLPQFTVEVYPEWEADPRTHQRYVLVLRDATAGAVELEFASARDLGAFLTRTREALAAARKTTHVRRGRVQQAGARAVQATLF